MCPHTSRLAVTVFLPLSQEGGPMTGGSPSQEIWRRWVGERSLATWAAPRTAPRPVRSPYPPELGAPSGGPLFPSCP